MQKHVHGMMSCRTFEGFVLDYIDDKLPPHQKSLFESHMRRCRECRQYLEAYKRTQEITRAVFTSPDAPLPDEVPEDLIKAILKARNR